MEEPGPGVFVKKMHGMETLKFADLNRNCDSGLSLLATPTRDFNKLTVFRSFFINIFFPQIF